MHRHQFRRIGHKHGGDFNREYDGSRHHDSTRKQECECGTNGNLQRYGIWHGPSQLSMAVRALWQFHLYQSLGSDFRQLYHPGHRFN